MLKRGFIFFHFEKMKTVGNRKKNFSQFIPENSNFSHLRFLRKCSMFRWSIPLRQLYIDSLSFMHQCSFNQKMRLKYDKLKEINECAYRRIYARVKLRVETCTENHYTCTKSVHANFKFVEPSFSCSFSICLIKLISLLIAYIAMVEQIFPKGLQHLFLENLFNLLRE